MDHKDLLKRIELAFVSGVRSKPETIVRGPFLISINPAVKLRWLNNASVDGESDKVAASELQAMIQVFLEKDRMPRFELFRELHGPFIKLLQTEGFEIESEMPVMTCTQDTFRPQLSADIQVEILGPDSDPTTFLRVVDIAFEHDEPITPARIEGTRLSLRRGTQWIAIAKIGDKPAAVASLVVSGAVSELAGVGTVPEMRRRGAASSASTKLIEQFFAEADLVWLSAGDDVAQKVYERMGFEVAGVQVNISKPD